MPNPFYDPKKLRKIVNTTLLLLTVFWLAFLATSEFEVVRYVPA